MMLILKSKQAIHILLYMYIYTLNAGLFFLYIYMQILEISKKQI